MEDATEPTSRIDARIASSCGGAARRSARARALARAAAGEAEPVLLIAALIRAQSECA